MTTSIEILKFRALAAIDVAASEVRRRMITDIAGQSETYAAKRAEAIKFLADRELNPTAAPGPYLAADLAANGGNALAKALSIITASDNYSINRDPLLEAQRTGGKARVRLASTLNDVQAERDAAIAAIEAVIV